MDQTRIIALAVILLLIVGVVLGWLATRRRNKTIAPPVGSADTTVPRPSPVIASPWQSVLEKTRSRWFSFGSKEARINREQLEEALLGADVGFKAAQDLLGKIDFSHPWGDVQMSLAGEICKIFPTTAQWPEKRHTPHIILFIGVNGVGKTTSIAKLARELKQRGHSVILAAGDTFRAAAAEQLKAWADRLDIPCIMGGANADSSAVLFDAVKSGVAKGADFVICDSAGRLHNNEQLMENLAKNKRVLDKALPGAPHDTLLVLDANTGQNMLTQGKKFLELGLSGLILTKLDGSAKGGAVIPLVQDLKLPIFKVGVGEGETDMMPFDAKSFADSLVGIRDRV